MYRVGNLIFHIRRVKGLERNSPEPTASQVDEEARRFPGKASQLRHISCDRGPNVLYVHMGASQGPVYKNAVLYYLGDLKRDPRLNTEDFRN